MDGRQKIFKRAIGKLLLESPGILNNRREIRIVRHCSMFEYFHQIAAGRRIKFPQGPRDDKQDE
jgi:hypothetical protein